MSYGTIWEWFVLGPNLEAELATLLFEPRGLTPADRAAGERSFAAQGTSFYACLPRENHTIAFLRNVVIEGDEIARVFAGHDGIHIQREEMSARNSVTVYLAGAPLWWVSYGHGELGHGGKLPEHVHRIVEGAAGDVDGKVVVTIASRMIRLDPETFDPKSRVYMVGGTTKATRPAAAVWQRTVSLANAPDVEAAGKSDLTAALKRFDRVTHPSVRLTLGDPANRRVLSIEARVEDGQLRVEVVDDKRFRAARRDLAELDVADLGPLFRAFFDRGTRTETSYKWRQIYE